MNERPNRPAKATDGKAAERAERLAQALRANLRRRKAQARGEESPPPDADDQ